jgi:DNA-binding MarR family transcriptional regulator
MKNGTRNLALDFPTELTTQRPGHEDWLLANYIPFQIAAVAQLHAQRTGEVAQDVGLTATEWRVLTLAVSFEGIGAIDISRRTLLDQVATHRAVMKLLKKGLIQRSTDPHDRRRQCLRPTQTGKTLCNAILSKAQALESDLLSALTKTERADFGRALEKLFRDAIAPAQRHEDASFAPAPLAARARNRMRKTALAD